MPPSPSLPPPLPPSPPLPSALPPPPHGRGENRGEVRRSARGAQMAPRAGTGPARLPFGARRRDTRAPRLHACTLARAIERVPLPKADWRLKRDIAIDCSRLSVSSRALLAQKRTSGPIREFHWTGRARNRAGPLLVSSVFLFNASRAGGSNIAPIIAQRLITIQSRRYVRRGAEGSGRGTIARTFPEQRGLHAESYATGRV
jgi:hypothetical protein